MLRTTSTALLVLAPMPALAAGYGLEEAIFSWLMVLIVGAIPAAGVGYVLGSFLRPPASILVLATLALVPTALLWAARGFAQAVDFALAHFAMLLMFSPLIFVGWRFGRRDAMQLMARKSLLQNGH
jgi:hypothetical protein